MTNGGTIPDGPDSLLAEIAHCPVVAVCRSGAVHPCSDIVAVQASTPMPKHQVPEPWTGQLEYALILFISSNPSISETEDYPRWEDSDQQITDYFADRFDGNPGQIKDGIYPPLAEGGWSPKWTYFWAAVRARARELIDNPVPGIDYALTEVVHCKSRDEVGVAKARKFCSDRYLGRILEQASRAVVLIVYGAHAARSVAELYGIELNGQKRYATVAAPNGQQRHVIYLDHPAGFQPVKKISTALSENERNAARDAVRVSAAARNASATRRNEEESQFEQVWPLPEVVTLLAFPSGETWCRWTWLPGQDVVLQVGGDLEELFGDEIPYYQWETVDSTVRWAERQGWRVGTPCYGTGQSSEGLPDRENHVASPTLPTDADDLSRGGGLTAILSAGGDLLQPRPWEWTPRSPGLLGDVGPWTWAIPDLFAAIADPEGFPQRPRYQAADPRARDVPLWSALLTMCWGVFGWAHPQLGIARWIAAGSPVPEPAAKILDQWWGQDAAAICEWARRSPVLREYSEAVSNGTTARSHPRLQVVPTRATPSPEWSALMEGGTDPLHLQHVVEHLVKEEIAVLTPVHDGVRGNRAVLLLDEYSGWYRAIHMAGEMLPTRQDDLKWLMDVVVPSIGTLGTFQRSAVTGRWHSCSEWWHLLGYPL